MSTSTILSVFPLIRFGLSPDANYALSSIMIHVHFRSAFIYWFLHYSDDHLTQGDIICVFIVCQY